MMLAARASRYLTAVGTWILLGFGFSLISVATREADTPRSPYWLLEAPLFLLVAIGWWRGRSGRSRHWSTFSPTRSTIAYVAISWLAGMTYEMTLTRDGTGIGGMHAETVPSFLLAQGFYVLLALGGLASVHRFRLGFRDAFFLAAGVSLVEAVFTGVLVTALLSPSAVLAPLMICYFALVYSCFLALPLLLIEPSQIWSARAPRAPLPIWRLMLGGFALGGSVSLVWGLGIGPLTEWLFDLPPNRY